MSEHVANSCDGDTALSEHVANSCDGDTALSEHVANSCDGDTALCHNMWQTVVMVILHCVRTCGEQL